MPYTFEPKYKFAKAYGRNVGVSTKASVKICRVIRNKPLKRAKRLLEDLSTERRSLRGKYYTNSVKEILNLVNSCEKNAEFLGLDTNRLFVNASAHMGPNIRRRRRKAGFGSKMKATHLEIMLVERGKEQETKVSKKKIEQSKKKEKTEAEKELLEEKSKIMDDVKEIKKKETKIAKDEKKMEELKKEKFGD